MLDTCQVVENKFLILTPDAEKTRYYGQFIPNTEIVQLAGVAGQRDQAELNQAWVNELDEELDVVAIVHRPPLNANHIVKQLRNLPQGKDLYIIVIIPHDVEDHVGVTADVDDYLVLTEKELSQSILERCVSRYERNLEVRHEFDTATRTAANAIESASEYGSLIHFFEASESCNTISDLIVAVGDFMDSRNLAVDFVIDTQSVCEYWDNTQNHRNHRVMLDRMRLAKRRMVAVDKLLGFSFDHFSLLVSNAPHHQPEKYGQLKDTLAHFCAITESRIKCLMIKDSIAGQHQAVVQVMDMIRSSTVDTKLHIDIIMKTLVQEIEVAATTFDMNLAEEQKLLELANNAASSLSDFQENNRLLEAHFLNLVESITSIKNLACGVGQGPVQSDSVELF